MATHQFQTEVGQLLHLITHSLYSHKEIFIRELVSNSSDALDKLKYLTLTDDAMKELSFDPKIHLEFEEGDAPTLTITDNGIGMNDAELAEHLGTIAKSGTKAFLGQLTGDQKKDSNLIGQFGVGFYSAFMLADTIDVYSRKAGEDTLWKWSSDGQGAFSVDEVGADDEEGKKLEGQGTRIICHLNDEGKEYASRWKVQDVIKKYSNHIAFPIFMTYEKTEYDDKGKEKGSETVTEQVNSANALWKRSKSELSDEDYKEFYKTLSHEQDEPLFWLHTQAEGTLEYTTLFYVPKNAPFDMNYADYRPGVKLYVRRVFITDDEKELMPTYLRFLRGIIDSEDLPLNVSREILQQNRVMTNIKTASVKKVLAELKRIALEDPDSYKAFTEQYNRPLKEGLYTDFAHKEDLMELVRFKSTKAEGYTSLAEYKDRMLPDQKAIYYITGDKESTLRNSPLLEAYKKKDIEVLIMDDDVDEIVVPGLMKYQDIDLKAVNRSDAGEDLNEKADKKKEKETKPVVEKVKKALGERVKEVKVSVRLADSPSCIVVDENDPTFQMQSMMKAMGQGAEMPDIVPILEINPDHEIVKKLKDLEDEDRIADVASLLLDQALLVEGVQLKDPADFVKRLNRVMGSAL
jgi:molecular chaperone HtpG